MKTDRDSLGFIHWTVDDLDLPGNTLKVYLRLVRRAGKRKTTYQSARSLSEEMNLSEKSIRGGINELIELGLIARTITPNRKGGSSSQFRILKASEWVGFEKPDPVDSTASEPDPSRSILPVEPVDSTASLEEKSKTRLEKPKGGGRSRKVKRADFLPGDSIPTEWIDEDFLAAWHDWAILRATSTLTTGVITKNSKVLAESGSKANALAILAKSEQMGWRGLFPLNGGKKVTTAREFDRPNDDIVNELLT